MVKFIFIVLFVIFAIAMIKINVDFSYQHSAVCNGENCIDSGCPVIDWEIK